MVVGNDVTSSPLCVLSIWAVLAVLVLGTTEKDAELADNLTEVIIGAIAQRQGAELAGGRRPDRCPPATRREPREPGRACARARRRRGRSRRSREIRGQAGRLGGERRSLG